MDENLRLNADDKVSDDLVDVVVYGASYADVRTTEVNVEAEWMVYAIDDDLNEVVNVDVVILRDVTELLSQIDVESNGDELEDVTGECVCPYVEVLLLEDIVVEDDVNVL